MDLGIALINYGLSLDWKDPTNKKVPRPSYVRQRKDWVPCDCHDKGASGQIRCFFCLHGMTHKIAHQDVCQKRATPSTARKVCSDRVDIGKGVAYCYYCIEEVKAENPGIKVADARRLAALNAKTTNNKPSTRLGCKTCNMHVCGRHWDDHGKND